MICSLCWPIGHSACAHLHGFFERAPEWLLPAWGMEATKRPALRPEQATRRLLLRARAPGAELPTVYPGRRGKLPVLIPLCVCVWLGLWCSPLVLVRIAIIPGPWHDRPRRGLWYYAFYYAFTMRSCSRPRSRLRSAARTHPED